MPRRNHRESTEYPPIDLTSKSDALLGRPRTQHPYRFPSAAETREKEARDAERQREARIQGGIDWSTCLVPGCGQRLAEWIDGARHHEYLRDASLALPLCKEHGVIVWQQVQRFRLLPDVVETAQQLAERHRREAGRGLTQQAQESDDGGELYFVRINNLVKVGWTQTLPRRLKEYGAGAELLCHYPGTRDEETQLHRRLTAVRAKGREWYHDGEVIQRRVTQVVEEFGPPTAKAAWTEPKNPVTIIRHASTG